MVKMVVMTVWIGRVKGGEKVKDQVVVALYSALMRYMSWYFAWQNTRPAGAEMIARSATPEAVPLAADSPENQLQVGGVDV